VLRVLCCGRPGPGFVLLWLAVLFKAIDALAHIIVPTPSEKHRSMPATDAGAGHPWRDLSNYMAEAKPLARTTMRSQVDTDANSGGDGISGGGDGSALGSCSPFPAARNLDGIPGESGRVLLPPLVSPLALDRTSRAEEGSLGGSQRGSAHSKLPMVAEPAAAPARASSPAPGAAGPSGAALVPVTAQPDSKKTEKGNASVTYEPAEEVMV